MSIFTGLISSAFKQLHADAIIEVVRGSAIPCTLVYANPPSTTCPNCIFDNAGNKSSGRYKAGGAQTFVGICPICLGRGILIVETSVSIDLALIYDSKSWIPLRTGVNSPLGFVQTLSLLSTMDDIKKAKELITDVVDLSTQVRQRFERYGEPETCGFGQSTIIATMWKRIEN